MSSSNPVPAAAPAAQPDGPFTFQQVQADEEKAFADGKAERSALCISGGGIRSATFALGALQGLAELGILEHFDYLSTVSGGGYIGSWLTAWKERPPAGMDKVVPALKPAAPFPPEGTPDPVQHLREYNNYLSPKLGLFSADTWTLVATVTRNMLLNWLVFIPLLLFGLMIPRIILSLARVGEAYASLYPPPVVKLINYMDDYHVFIIVGGLLFALCIFNVMRYLPSVGNKDHTEGDFLKYCLAPLFLAAVAVVSEESWFSAGDILNGIPPRYSYLQWFLGMTISGFVGWVAYLLTHKAIWRRWQRVVGITVALVLGAAALAWATWLLSVDSSDLGWSLYISLAIPMLLSVFALAVTLFVGLTSLVLEDEDREWFSRAGAWVLLTVLTWAAFCSLVLLAPQYLLLVHGKLAVWLDSALAAGGGLGGIIAALAGLSRKNKARKDKDGNGSAEASSGGLVDLAAKLAAPAFILVFLVSLALLTDWIIWKTGRVVINWNDPYAPQQGFHGLLLQNTRIQDTLVLAFIFLVFSFIMARYININKFSLQAMYRSRLIRAYQGASNQDSKTNPFTGFADNDNLFMSQLTPGLKPFHVVNITLNLVSGKRLAWQQRKAESFTVSALHSGYGAYYRPSKKYAGQRGISLGTAVAISGAAASPNMGYHSSPSMAFVMTLFNARLGAWLGNPGRKRWKDEGPRTAFDSIVREAFGLTNDTSPYVYLSDGGHFENLALYEMIHRRCRYIVVLDGGADPTYTYEDLGNALRKIRIDRKVSIIFESAVHVGPPEVRCAVAKIHYPDAPEGQLVYVKPVVLGTEPPDVAAYKAANVDFPHQSTGDQWFDESQTESYRMLGLCSIVEVFKTWDPKKEFQAVMDSAREHMKPKAKGVGA